MKLTNANSTITNINGINICKLNNIALSIKKLDIEHNDINGYNHLLYELNVYINLKYLKISSNIFNQIIDNTYNKLKYLYIESINFNQELDNLPNLIVLSIKSNNFNQSISNLPYTLKKLIIYSDIFNQELDLLPQNLRQLYILSKVFNKCVDNLPSDVRIFQLLSDEFNHKLECLPNKLQTFIINDNKNIIINKIPLSLKTIMIINNDINKIFFNYEIPSIYILKKSSKRYFKSKVQILIYYHNDIIESKFRYYFGVIGLSDPDLYYKVSNFNNYIKNNIKLDNYYTKFVGYNDDIYYTHSISDKNILTILQISPKFIITICMFCIIIFSAIFSD